MLDIASCIPKAMVPTNRDAARKKRRNAVYIGWSEKGGGGLRGARLDLMRFANTCGPRANASGRLLRRQSGTIAGKWGGSDRLRFGMREAVSAFETASL